MNALKIAIVGTGSVAKNSYLPYLSQRKDVALSYYSRTISRAEECAKSFGGRVAQSLEDLMADAPDSVMVLTNETERAGVAEKLLEHHPKRLFFEKPLCAKNGQANVGEEDFFAARALLARAQAEGVPTAMIFNYRFFEQTKRLNELIASKKLGKLIQASLFVNYACWSHCLDLLRLWGGRAAKVSSIAGTTPYGNEASKAVDIAAAFILEGGACGTLLGSSGPSFQAPLYATTLNFEKGMVRICDLDASLDIYVNGEQYVESHSLLANYSRWNQYSASFEKSLAAYLQSIVEQKEPPVSGMAGLEELQFEAALRRSAAEGRQVEVQQEFPLNLPDTTIKL